MTTPAAALADREASTERSAPAPGMVWIPGGTFMMGSDSHYPEEAPAHQVTVDGFWIDATTVTNREFARFVAATGYVTLAEKPADPAAYPGAKPELLVPSSVVFRPPAGNIGLEDAYRWWSYAPGADWRHPDGPGSSIVELMDHPVVHVAWEDVEAYARWAGKHLPTEAEWERAARGGLDGAEFVWGNEFRPGDEYMANTWQGEFPWRNLAGDGFERTAPANAFPPNGYGLYNMAGNVWEWTDDWYQDHGRIARPCCTLVNPRGGSREASVDPRDSIGIPRKVMKGGSFLCAPSYCRRYRPAARMSQQIDTATCHLGFRCVVRPASGA
ncbi:MAG: formylglycine-generating enzyme family protein [Alphaproteobacteria bacterium]